MPHEKTATLPTTQEIAPDPAEKLLAAKRRRDAEQKAREDKELNAKFVHYLKCPRVPGHVAAFLTEYPKPGAVITPGHHYSRFRKPGDPHQQPFIQCQECIYEGERRPWMVALKAHRRQDMSFDFTIEDRYRDSVLGKMPRDDAEKEVAANG